MAKSGVKPIFSPLPTPPFSPRNLRFSRFSPFRTRFRAIFRGYAPVFCPVKSTFFSSFLVLGLTSDDFRGIVLVFSRSTVYFLSHSPILNPISGDFFDGTSLFSAPKLTFSLLFPVLPHASGTSSRDLTHYFLRTPFFTQRECFSDSCFPHSSRPAPPFSPDLLPSRSSSPSLFASSPLSFSFLPTFPSPSPINARSHAPSRNTRVRVHPYAPIRQEVFVYCLHRFTHPSQTTVNQHTRCEGKEEKAFTKNSITSQSTH